MGFHQPFNTKLWQKGRSCVPNYNGRSLYTKWNIVQNTTVGKNLHSSAGGTSFKSKPSTGNSGVIGPNIPSVVKVKPLCMVKTSNHLISNPTYIDIMM